MTAGVEVPDLVPVRMVNEFSYCPRLFFLEWVEARFADNDYTVDGRYQHRVVDRAGGTVLGADEDLPFKARQVQLSSTDLGVVGRVDLLEGDGSKVRPVDYKRGTPPATELGVWEPERVQLCVLGLLLREAGYECDEGVIYFAEAHIRVTVAFDDDLVKLSLALISDLKEVAASSEPPPPLVDSPKCPKCSLVGICLPDETNSLLVRTSRPARRLIAGDPQSRPVYVTAPGSYVGVRGGRLEVTLKRRSADKSSQSEKLASVRLIDVSQLCVFGNAQVSTQALRELWSRDVLILWFSTGGWLSGVGSGMPSKHVHLRRRQVAIAGQGGVEIARELVAGKIRNSRTLLRRNGKPAPAKTLLAIAGILNDVGTAETAASLLGYEGSAARLYFEAFPTMLRPEMSLPGQAFSFDGRNRRPPADPVNCLLSFVYALLVKDLVAVLIGVGFDPYLGFYHRPRFGRPALALDLAEECRSLIGDSVVINLINNGEIQPNDFVIRAGGVSLTPEGRRSVIAAYERRLEIEITHPTFGYKVSYRRVLEIQARLLAATVMGEIPKYSAFTTR